MKSLVVLLGLVGLSIAAYYPPGPWGQYRFAPFLGYDQPCSNYVNSETLISFQKSYYETLTLLFRKIVSESEAHFAFSPLTIWQTLAAIAEGSEGRTREELSRFLGLPLDRCERKLFYEIAAGRENFGKDLTVLRNKEMFIDSNLLMNRNWETYVYSQKLMNVKQVPYKASPIEIENWKRTFNMYLPHLNLNGNSVVMESADFTALWKTGFADTLVAPFYNSLGEEEVPIEYMRMKRRVKMAYLPAYNMKILELPVGNDNRYSVLLSMVMGKSVSPGFRSTLESVQTTAVFEAVSRLKMSAVPIEIVIPRLVMTSEIDVRSLLEDLGIASLWNDPYGTRNISEPAAQPSAYVQRVSLTLNEDGIESNIPYYSNLIPGGPWDPSVNGTGVDPALGQDFIANRPFLFGLFDTETWTCVFAASFSKPL